jgi:hypothetical protein
MPAERPRYDETCPRCKGWVYHRPEPCDCGPGGATAVGLLRRLIAVYENTKFADSFDEKIGELVAEARAILAEAGERTLSKTEEYSRPGPVSDTYDGPSDSRPGIPACFLPKSVGHIPAPYCAENVLANDGAETDICLGYPVEGGGNPIIIASVYHDDETGPGRFSLAEAEATARLFAAAPDTLDELNRCRRVTTDIYNLAADCLDRGGERATETLERIRELAGDGLTTNGDTSK